VAVRAEEKEDGVDPVPVGGVLAAARGQEAQWREEVQRRCSDATGVGRVGVAAAATRERAGGARRKFLAACWRPARSTS